MVGEFERVRAAQNAASNANVVSFATFNLDLEGGSYAC